jgi:hypothetical protein
MSKFLSAIRRQLSPRAGNTLAALQLTSPCTAGATIDTSKHQASLLAYAGYRLQQVGDALFADSISNLLPLYPAKTTSPARRPSARRKAAHVRHHHPRRHRLLGAAPLQQDRAAAAAGRRGLHRPVRGRGALVRRRLPGRHRVLGPGRVGPDHPAGAARRPGVVSRCAATRSRAQPRSRAISHDPRPRERARSRAISRNAQSRAQLAP